MANELVSTRTMQMMLLSTRTLQMRELSTRTMVEDGDKHNNNANELLSTRTMATDVAKHKNVAKCGCQAQVK